MGLSIIYLLFNSYFKWHQKSQRYAGSLFLISGIIFLISNNLYGKIIFHEFSNKISYFLSLSSYGAQFLFANLTNNDYFFTGSGPGQAKELRHQYGYTGQVTAHTEFSRMLAEHGILGLLSLLILIIITGHIFVKSDTRNSKFIKLCFGLIALLSMGHSAMRLAMPEFIYGLIFMTLNDDSQINNNQIV